MNKIKEEIFKQQDKILSNIKLESVSVYLFLKNEHKKGNILDNTLFQFIFRSFYGLDNAGLSDKWKEYYFKLLANKQQDLRKILSELYEIYNLRDLNTIQFSFATKLLHTLDNKNPIFDAEISRVFHKPRQGSNKEEKIESCLKIYEYLENTYKDFLQDERIKKVISKFKSKFKVKNDEISDIKVLDFIIWSLGKLIK